MPTATWRDTPIATSADTLVVEGNHYFPTSALDMDRLRPSDTRTTCSWKGVAHYYDVVVNGEVNRDAAWFYPDPKPAAAEIRDRVAFWRGVRVA